jgi:hypothetical protein
MRFYVGNHWTDYRDIAFQIDVTLGTPYPTGGDFSIPFQLTGGFTQEVERVLIGGFADDQRGLLHFGRGGVFDD